MIKALAESSCEEDRKSKGENSCSIIRLPFRIASQNPYLYLPLLFHIYLGKGNQNVPNWSTGSLATGNGSCVETLRETYGEGFWTNEVLEVSKILICIACIFLPRTDEAIFVHADPRTQRHLQNM